MCWKASCCWSFRMSGSHAMMVSSASGSRRTSSVEIFRKPFDARLFREGAELSPRSVVGRVRFSAAEEEGEDEVLLWGALFEFFQIFGVGVFLRGGDAAGFGGVVLAADCFREDGADDAFNTRPVVVGDPAGDFKRVGVISGSGSMRDFTSRMANSLCSGGGMTESTVPEVVFWRMGTRTRHPASTGRSAGMA